MGRRVFGYLEIAFKVGRSVTIGGFTGALRDRTWNRVDDELELSRKERTAPSHKVPPAPMAYRSRPAPHTGSRIWCYTTTRSMTRPRTGQVHSHPAATRSRTARAERLAFDRKPATGLAAMRST
jgi:hypothetical protein